ncbi:hypothetical protein AURDEDRAFT_166826 [Auricularia subglabra TFB-10046 SS5]|nr:hypothetical protein AURDEDRAFT_166826 [Auricularia subglabra TFB-10046 SS5]
MSLPPPKPPIHEGGRRPHFADAAEVSSNRLDYPESESCVQRLQRAIASPRDVLARWRRPSVYWVLPLAALRLLAEAMQAAPAVELFTRMACQVHRPDLGIEHVRFPGWRDGDDPLAPTRGQLCAEDSAVQQATATIITVFGALAGVLTTATAGWWGQRSDLWGRTIVLAVTALASLVRDGNIILAVLFSGRLPGISYWWLLPGTILIGLLGGATGNAALQAYLSDCTAPGTRAAVFAVNTGLSWGGVAIAPILGAQLIKRTGDLLSVFYASLAANLVVFLMFILLVPESLAPEHRAENKRKSDESRGKRLARVAGTRCRWTQVSCWLRNSFVADLLRPLKVFIPTWRDADDRKAGRDWNFAVMGATYLLIAIGTGYALFLMQLGQILWGWDSEMTGYWLSLLGLCRAIYLLLLFPLIIRIFKPKTPGVKLEGPEGQLVASSSTSSGDSDIDTQKKPATPAFDLTLTQAVLAIETAVYVLVVLSRTPKEWTASTMGIALGGSLSPSLMSLALALSPGGSAEAGSLFGAFSVLLSLGDDVLGHLLSGTIFTLTVAIFPRAILLVSAALHGLAFALLFLIRLPSTDKHSSASL